MDARTIAERGTILRGIVGSTSHGLAIADQDDRDEMGICIPPADCVLGLSHFEQWTHRTKPEGQRSGPGDEDIVVYSLRKWASLALKGNPTVLVLLFLPESMLTTTTDLGRRLRSMAPAFASKAAAKPFLGYMMAQRQRLAGERGQLRVHRPELVEAHGFDTKYAGHVIRLGHQGVEFLETGRITLPMPEKQRQECLAIRRGEWTLHDVLTRAGELEKELREAEWTSPLSENPDHEAVEYYLIQAHLESWGVDRD